MTLLVKLNRPISLGEIEEAASSALGELLHLDGNPGIMARFDESDQGGSPSNGQLTETSNRVLCSLPRYHERVAVTPMTVPVQVVNDDGSCSFADEAHVSIGWQVRKSPLCWALVGAVALGMARNSGSEIEDNSGFFTIANVQRPDEFCRMLRVPTPQPDLESAAETLYNRMPKSVEIAEWLERQSR
ncbi:MAG: hypothetical protein U0R19_02325 [Bryobacteraceae bacterium]